MRVTSSRWTLAGALALLPEAAWACAVCRFGEGDPSADAFLVSTIVMSLVPLGMIGGGLYYVFRRVEKTRALEAAALETGEP